MKSSFASGVLEFYSRLDLPQNLPQGVETLYPFSDETVWQLNKTFYHRFYNDQNPRSFLIGINPGRLGAGVTGIPFTDPLRLENVLKIKNGFQKKAELSSKFIYDVIESIGGSDPFFSNFYITSVSPIGYTKDGRNLNYYDQKDLENSLHDYIIENLWKQINTLPTNRDTAFCLGLGKNYKYLCKLNEKEGFFKEIIPLPHPRWVMQYRLKRKEEFILDYQRNLLKEIKF